MSNSKSILSVVLPSLFAVLLICGIVLFTCLCCTKARMLERRGISGGYDEESSVSSDEKRDSDISSQSDVGPPVAEEIQIVDAGLPVDDSAGARIGANVVEVGPDQPHIYEARP